MTTNYSIGRRYDHPEHGECRLHVELLDTFEREEMAEHRPAYVDGDPRHPDLDRQLRPAHIQVADQTIADVVLELPDGQTKRRRASIFRHAHTMGIDDGWATSTSCAIKDETAVRRDRQEGGYKRDHPIKQDRTMLWDWTSEEWHTVSDLLEELCATASVLFDDDVPDNARYATEHRDEIEHNP